MLIDTPASASDWVFPAEEYLALATRLCAVMRQEGVELLIIDQFEHLAYYTGHIPTAAMYQCCLFPLEGEPLMIVRSLDGTGRCWRK